MLWVTIQFAFKAPMFAAEHGWRGVGLSYLEAFIEPFGTLWFIYLLPIFFVVTKLTRRHAVAADLARCGAGLEIAQIDTGWTVIDEFARRFVYFYTGYIFAPQSSRSPRACSDAAARGADRACALGASSTARWCRRAPPTCRSFRSRSASPAPARWSRSRR